MRKHKHEKLVDFFVPISFAVLWGILALGFRGLG